MGSATMYVAAGFLWGEKKPTRILPLEKFPLGQQSVHTKAKKKHQDIIVQTYLTVGERLSYCPLVPVKVKTKKKKKENNKNENKNKKKVRLKPDYFLTYN